MVSRSDSPFFTLLLATASERTSALSLLAAVSKLSRVLVDSSKKSDATTRPFRAGTFFIVRLFTSTNDSAVSRISRIASFETLLSESRFPPRIEVIISSLLSTRRRDSPRLLQLQRLEDSFQRSQVGLEVHGGRGQPSRRVELPSGDRSQKEH